MDGPVCPVYPNDVRDYEWAFCESHLPPDLADVRCPQRAYTQREPPLCMFRHPLYFHKHISTCLGLHTCGPFDPASRAVMVATFSLATPYEASIEGQRLTSVAGHFFCSLPCRQKPQTAPGGPAGPA
jgi:hypothetical protein